MLTGTVLRMKGVSLTETLIMMPVFLMLTLGIIQFALIYEAKATLDYATFMGARAGAVDHAQQSAITEGLAKSLSPLFSPDLHDQTALQATIAKARAEIAAFSDIKIINPTTEAFDDFGINVKGQLSIPNTMLHVRDPKPGDRSRVNIQDANLLKVQVLYGHRLQVPFVNRIISVVTSWYTSDPVKLAFLRQQRLPILATATVRMQSDPWKNDWMMRLADVNKAIDEASQAGESLNLATLPRPWGGPTGERDRGSSGHSGGQSGSAASNDSGTTPDGSINNGENLNDGTGQGSPSACNTSQATSQPTSVQAASAGNPVHIVTGNKYQLEVDLSPLPGVLGLEFSRHYNSQTSYHSVMGYGWSHTYDAQLSILPSGNIKLRQSDGRNLYFTLYHNNQYYSQQASDGHLNKLDNGFDWVWSNGKTLQFSNKGQLVRISNRQGDVLNLIYIGKQLHKVIDANQRTLVFSYTKKGHLKKLIDPAGKQFHYYYDKNNNLISRHNAAGFKRQYHYDDGHDPHNLTGITDERGVRFANWSYDDKDRAILSSHADNVEKITLQYLPAQTKVTNSQGISTIFHTSYRNGIPIVTQVNGPGCSTCGASETSYDYNDRIQLTKVTGRDGISKRYVYDDQSRLIQISEHHAGSVRVIAKYGYEADNIQPSLITEPGINPDAMHQWWLFYTDSGQIERITEVGYTPDGENRYQEMTRTTQYSYDNNRLVSVDGPVPGNSDKILYHYSKTGELTSIQTPEGKQLANAKNTLDAYGRPSQLHHFDGSVATLKYNSQNLLASVSFTNNKSIIKPISLDYDAVGNLRSLSGPKGEARVEYDRSGRPVTLIAPDGQQMQWMWNTENQLIDKKHYQQDGTLLTHESFEFDQSGRLLSTQTGLNSYYYHYDQQGRLVSVVDPLNRENRYKYDNWNRITAITKAANSNSAATEQFQYDVYNRRIVLTDARGNSSHSAYDDFGNRLYRYTPDGGVKVYRYNARGQVIASVDESALITRFDYDQTGRLSGIGAFDLPSTTHFEYKNRYATQDSIYQNTRRTYDKNGKIIRRDITLKDLDKVFSTQYKYNDNGQLQYKTLPDGQRLTYKYSADGNLLSLEKEGLLFNRSIIDELEFTSDGLVKSLTQGNKHNIKNDYDEQGRLASQNSTWQTRKNYVYDNLGKLARITNGNENHLYEYDSQDRLVKASEDNNHYQWQYDATGNRVRSDENGEINHYKYAKNSNRLLEQNGKHIKYRTTGQPTSNGPLRYEYTLGGRPAKVYRGKTLIAEYRYNSEGERIRKIDHTQTPAQTTYYLYENKQLVAEINAQGKVIRQYIYIGQQPIATLQNNKIYAIHTDHRHAPIAVTDQDGDIIWRAQYSPFGQAKIQTNKTSMNLRLPGQYYDAETGTHYNIYRDYDPSTGRYLSSDPLGNRAGLNTYTYVKNDPLNRIDPLGLYDELVHYYMTYFLAVVAGIPEDQSRIIASAAQFIDDNDYTKPIGPNVVNSLPTYHFTLDYDNKYFGDRSNSTLDRFKNPSSKQLELLHRTAMRTTHSVCAKTQLYGEYLHSLQDSFSHRDRYNRPYASWNEETGDPGSLLGHVFTGDWGHAPDHTYNQYRERRVNDPSAIPGGQRYFVDQWAYNEMRTLEMEKNVFNNLLNLSQSSGMIENKTEWLFNWNDIAGDGDARIGLPNNHAGVIDDAGNHVIGYVPQKGKGGILQIFNAFNEKQDEYTILTGREKGQVIDGKKAKIQILIDWLQSNGFNKIPKYDQGIARENRKDNLEKLDHTDYPGIILDTELF